MFFLTVFSASLLWAMRVIQFDCVVGEEGEGEGIDGVGVDWVGGVGRRGEGDEGGILG